MSSHTQLQYHMIKVYAKVKVVDGDSNKIVIIFVIILIYTFNDDIKRQRILIRYHNVLKYVDDIINAYSVHVIQFNIQDIKCTTSRMYRYKNYYSLVSK